MSITSLFGKVTRSLLGKLVTGLCVLFTITTLSVLYAVNGFVGNVRDVYSGQLRDKVQSSQELVNQEAQRLRSYMTTVEKAHPAIATTLSEGDFSFLQTRCEVAVNLQNLVGYVLADAEGNFRASSFEGFTPEQYEQLRSLLLYVGTVPDKTYSGICDLLNKGVCFVTIRYFANAEGQDGAIAVFVPHVFENNDYLADDARIFNVNTSLYRDSVCTATSVPDSLFGFSLVGLPMPQASIVDSVKGRMDSYTTIDEMDDHVFFSEYTPVLDYKGDVIAIHHMGFEAQRVADSISHIKKTFTVLGIGIAVTIAIIVIFIRRTVAKPIQRLTADARLIASGDLSKPISKVYTNDEMSQLRAGMEMMRSQLRDNLASFTDAANTLHASSDEFTRAASRLSDGANKQAASLEEISSSLEEMRSTIHQNTDSAQRTEGMMHRADEAVTKVAQTSDENKVATQKIEGSIKAINDLVNQTNILSLNASVEAARAGSAGRGFAVVAKEVGRLADQTKLTAAEVGDTARQSINGAEQINEMLDRVAPQLHEVAELVRQITVSSREQGAGADQINTAVLNLNGVTQENAAGAEEVAANAHELAQVAAHMKAIADKFKI